ncbi:MAG: hypothetical protein R3Y59_08005 [bacterium]
MKSKKMEGLMLSSSMNGSELELESGFLILNEDQLEDVYGGWNFLCVNNNCNKNCN